MAEESLKPPEGGAYSYRGRVQLDYAPERDNEPDPGEIVWTWVPYEEDEQLGKDRPLLVIGRADGRPDHFVALMLSTQDRGGDDGWVYLGRGAWDSGNRPSWVRVDRLLGVAQGAIRREAAALPPGQFLDLLERAAVEQRR